MAAHKKKNHSKPSQAHLTKIVAECIKLLDKATSTFGDEPALTAAAKRAVPKPRKSLGTAATAVAQLVKQHGVVLPKQSVDEMLANVGDVATLTPLLDAVAKLHRAVNDAVLIKNGDAWATATAFYTVLRRMERFDENLRVQLEGLRPAFVTHVKAGGLNAKGAKGASSANEANPPATAAPKGAATASTGNSTATNGGPTNGAAVLNGASTMHA